MTQDKIRIMLVDDQAARFKVLEEALTAQGYKVVAKVTTADNIQAEVELSQPDVIIADLDNPGRDTLESMQAITRKRPRPLVMFTNDDDSSTIELAVKSGVTAYIVDGMSPDRISPILDVAIMRFREFQTLRSAMNTQARSNGGSGLQTKASTPAGVSSSSCHGQTPFLFG